MTLTEIKPLSFSQMRTMQTCGEMYRLIYVEGAPRESSGPMIAGSAVHSTIEIAERLDLPKQFVDGGAFDEIEIRELLKSTFLELFNDELEAHGGEAVLQWGGQANATRLFPNGEDAAWWRHNGPNLLNRYLTVRMRDFETGIRLFDQSIERRVEAVIDGLPYLIIVDAALVVDPDGTLIVRDYKTGQVNADPPRQLLFYSYVLREAVGFTPSIGEYVYLRAPNDRFLKVQHEIDDRLDAMPDHVNEHLDLVESGTFEPKPSSLCKWCSVRKSCAYRQA